MKEVVPLGQDSTQKSFQNVKGKCLGIVFYNAKKSLFNKGKHQQTKAYVNVIQEGGSGFIPSRQQNLATLLSVSGFTFMKDKGV